VQNSTDGTAARAAQASAALQSLESTPSAVAVPVWDISGHMREYAAETQRTNAMDVITTELSAVRDTVDQASLDVASVEAERTVAAGLAASEAGSMAGDSNAEGLSSGAPDSGYHRRSGSQPWRAPAEVINEQARGRCPGPAAATVAVASTPRHQPDAMPQVQRLPIEDATGAGAGPHGARTTDAGTASTVNVHEASSTPTSVNVQPAVEIATAGTGVDGGGVEGRRGNSEPDEPGSSNHDEGQAAATARSDTDGSALSCAAACQHHARLAHCICHGA
jgi:hypothetical protein